MPSPGSGVERREPLHFLAGCHTRQLKHALSVPSLSLDGIYSAIGLPGLCYKMTPVITITAIILALIRSRMESFGVIWWYRLTPVVSGNWPIDEYCCISCVYNVRHRCLLVDCMTLANCHCQRTSKIISPFIIFLPFSICHFAVITRR